MQGTPASRRAFRNNQGFDRLLDCLEALAWKPRPDGVDEDQWQVEEVQLAEAQRLCLEVLGWATEDRAGARMFSVGVCVVWSDGRNRTAMRRCCSR